LGQSRGCQHGQKQLAGSCGEIGVAKLLDDHFDFSLAVKTVRLHNVSGFTAKTIQLRQHQRFTLASFGE
jgi:hypothetical protein